MHVMEIEIHSLSCASEDFKATSLLRNSKLPFNSSEFQIIGLPSGLPQSLSLYTITENTTKKMSHCTTKFLFSFHPSGSTM